MMGLINSSKHGLKKMPLDTKSIIDSINKQKFNREKKYNQSPIGRITNDITSLHKFWFHVSLSAIWVYQNVIKPITKPIRWFLLFAWKKYRLLWDKIVYVDDGYGKKVFSKVYGGIFLLATLAFMYIVPNIIDFGLDIGLYALTAKRNEVVYLTNSQEIDHINNVHSIQGCESLPCTDRDSIYFRIRFSWFNLLWTWVHGKIWFYPDYVAAAVPPVVSKCIITTYGIRLKTFMRSFNMYPDLVQVTCEPILKG
jgi:hypothetical protein